LIDLLREFGVDIVKDERGRVKTGTGDLDCPPPKDGDLQGWRASREGQKMLVLTRRVGERLIIGDDVTVNVLSIKGNQVRIGIDAPPEVTIHRQEVFERILKEREKLSQDKSNVRHIIRKPA